MNYRRRHIAYFLAANTGAEGGGAGGAEEPEKGKPDEAAEKEKQLEELKAELEKKEQELKALQDKAAEEKKAKMTEDERKKADDEAFRNDTLQKIRELTAKSMGLDEEQAALIKGDTVEEIEQNAKIIHDMLKKHDEETEKALKIQLAQTGAPGAGSETDNEVNAETFYRDILNKAKGGR